MKDLSKLSDQELLEEYEQTQITERIDCEMDGSGECGAIIAKIYEPIWDAFEAEFEKRAITLPTNQEIEFPF